MPSPRATVNVHRAVQTVFWWTVTLGVLAVLDDLTFGPFFWVVSRTAGPGWAFTLVLVIYVPAQVWLVRRGTATTPGRFARWFLDRLYLTRRVAAVAENEQRIHRRVLGAGSAVLLSPIIGGVLPPLLLASRGAPLGFVSRLSWATAVCYAVTFGALHGLLPAAI